jgi:alanyl-tRNA synthetase
LHKGVFIFKEKIMNANILRQRFLTFFQQRGHAVIGTASLIPENDPSVLFTTAGMHPLVPYLLGEAHPAGKRLANVQKCVRTGDIMEVGDDTHLTMFEMLGNWSLGDYGKQESITWSYEFLTEQLGLDPARISVTCFAGDADAPRDDESASIWRSLGITRIVFLPKKDNWWGPVGLTGPCGPDTEIFYDTDPSGPADQTLVTNPQRFWEVWNNVFIQYDKSMDGRYLPLAQANVDTGLGLDRMLALLQGVPSPYETDVFLPIMEHLRRLVRQPEPFPMRVIADHTRAAVFILAEGIQPGNVDQPYIVRRLIRRAVRYGREIGIEGHFLAALADTVIETLADPYVELCQQCDHILSALEREETKFQGTLVRGRHEFSRAVDQCRTSGESILAGEVVFKLYDTYGFPVELTQELAQQQGFQIDLGGYQQAFSAHQERSRQGAAGRFRGGLTERRSETIQLHTATHLLHESLRRVLGPHVEQRGSNITIERLRFDFSHTEKLTQEQIAAVETLINEQIQRDLPVSWQEMSLDEAKTSGAIGLFEDRYGDMVKVYSIGDFSREICGGPHVDHTGQLGRFQILKDEAVGSGLRRIRAVLG